jgi:phosphopantothenoylcysteine decarboxylase/phosphopantothenate--cysteine ligase
MDVEPPAGVELVRVESALELREAALKAAADSDVVIMAAAVADFRPAEVSDTKIKKVDGEDAPLVHLVRNPDILHELVERRNAEGGKQLIVGFAAETGDAQGDVLEHATAKLKRKGCDLLVVNHVGIGRVFGQDDNSVVILSGHGAEPESAAGSKADVAAAVIDRVGAELARVFPAV